MPDIQIVYLSALRETALGRLPSIPYPGFSLLVIFPFSSLNSCEAILEIHSCFAKQFDRFPQ